MSAAEVLAQHVICSCGDWAEDSVEHAQHQLDALKVAGYAVVDGVKTERRVMTPQGTSRAMRPNEELGAHVRSLGWWVEERHLTEWRRVGSAEADR